MTAAIEMHQLTKRYGASRGIEELDMEVTSGEVFGFLGPNGAGKSTTIRTLLDLQRPTSGSAQVLGLDSHERSLEIRRRVGYLPGRPAPVRPHDRRAARAVVQPGPGRSRRGARPRRWSTGSPSPWTGR